jgi:hypothetical protein
MVLSASELSSIYLYGVKIADKSGISLSPETYDFYIKSAQQEIEKYLNIKIMPQIIDEKMDFYQDEYRRFGYIAATYPVVKPFKLEGFLGTIKQIKYPKEWISSRKTSDGYTFYRRIFIVPTQSADPLQMGGETMLYSGVLPYTNMLGYNTIPNYWSIAYCTGYDDLPYDLIDIIGKMASIPLLLIAGDIPYGVPGLSSMSLSVDGLSQTLNTTASATHNLYSARVLQYKKDIDDTMKKIKAFYKGIVCTSI